MRFLKLSLIILVSFMVGILGGAAAFFYLIGNSSFCSGSGLSLAPVRVTEKQITAIQENKALRDAVAKSANTAVGIKVTNSKGASVYGSGVIFTSDGLVATSYNLFPPGTSAEVVADGEIAAFQVIKRDKDKNLVILKLKGSNWPTAGFYPIDNLKLGERIFLIGVLAGGGNLVNEGVVRDFAQDTISTSIIEKSEVQGSPVFDIEGNIVGIAVIDKLGWASVIPISTIKSLSGL